MAGKNGYRTSSDRIYEDLSSLKKHARVQGRVNEVRFAHTVATGGAGASVELEEKTGTTVSRLTTTNEAQVYIRAHTNAAGYDTYGVTLSWLDEAGVLYDPVYTAFNLADSTTEVAVSGATNYYRTHTMTSSVTPAAGHTFSIGDADHANDGSGNDLWGVIEESNYGSIHSRYYVPTANEAGKTMYGYLGKIRARYDGVVNGAGAIEYCTLTVTCTPADLGYETTLAYRIQAGEEFVWEAPFRLQGATDTTFVVADDAATGGNFEFEYVIVEVTRLV